METTKSPTKFGASVGVNMSGEMGMTFQASKKNLLGADETLAAEFTKSIRGGHLYNFSASKPFGRIDWAPGVYKSEAVLSCYRSLTQMPWSQASVAENGATLGYKSRFYSAQLNLAHRDFVSSLTAPPSVRGFEGSSSKYSLEHSVALVDTRNRRILPSSGGLIKLSQEVSFGNASFIKHQLDVQAAVPLFTGVFAGASFRSVATGVLGGGRVLHLLDRAYLGGPFNLRGFDLNTIGQRDDGANLGGVTSCFAAAHLYVPLPRKLFAHAFVTAGSVTNAHARWWIAELSEEMRITAGAGLTYLIDDAFRLELNYVVPIKTMANDGLSTYGKIQIGIGAEFL